MRLDPDNCPHCGVSWINEEVEVGPPLPPKMILVLDDPQYYRCEVCGAHTPLGIWNHGYKPEFLADVFIRGFHDGPKPEQ
jgi:hypothetical protein